MNGAASQRGLVIDREREGLMRFAEEFMIHVFLDISVVVIIDVFLQNYILSILIGDGIIEVTQFFWRKWRGQESE